MSFTYLQTDIREAWIWPDRRILGKVDQYLKLAIPSTLMICLDWWVWELMILLAGMIGVVEQAACIVIMHVVVLAAMVAFGLEQSCCALIGQEIGKNDVVNAKLYYNAFEILTTIILIILSILVYAFSDFLISIFTSEAQINLELQKLMWVFSINTFPDCYKGMLKGVIKALGIQNKAVYINISGHWCISVTL